MALNRPTISTIVDRISADISANITGAVTLAQKSVLRTLGRIYAGAVHLLYGFIDNLTDQFFATTAATTFLDQIGSEFGVIRNAATSAVGTITITGIPPSSGVLIPAGTELQNSGGFKYTTDAAVTLIASSITVAVTASEAGVDSNDVAGAVLTFTSPIINVDSTAAVDSDALTGGADIETDDDYRERILSRKRQAPSGGTELDLITWALENSGVTRAWTDDLFQGAGTIAVYFVRDNDTSIFPDAAEIATVRAYIVSHTDPATGQIVGIAVTAEPGLFVFAPTPLTVNMTINIFPNTTAVQNAITTNLEDLFLREAGPGQTLFLSRISESISQAAGEERHTLVSPAADVGAATNELQILGTITFGNF